MAQRQSRRQWHKKEGTSIEWGKTDVAFAASSSVSLDNRVPIYSFYLLYSDCNSRMVTRWRVMECRGELESEKDLGCGRFLTHSTACFRIHVPRWLSAKESRHLMDNLLLVHAYNNLPSLRLPYKGIRRKWWREREHNWWRVCTCTLRFGKIRNHPIFAADFFIRWKQLSLFLVAALTLPLVDPKSIAILFPIDTFVGETLVRSFWQRRIFIRRHVVLAYTTKQIPHFPNIIIHHHIIISERNPPQSPSATPVSPPNYHSTIIILYI